MPRPMTAAAQTWLAKDHAVQVHLYEAYFDDTTIYATDAPHPIEWNGNTYLALGHFIGFDSIQETADLQVAQTRVHLSLADQTWIALALAEDTIDRRLVIRRAFLYELDLVRLLAENWDYIMTEDGNNLCGEIE